MYNHRYTPHFPICCLSQNAPLWPRQCLLCHTVELLGSGVAEPQLWHLQRQPHTHIYTEIWLPSKTLTDIIWKSGRDFVSTITAYTQLKNDKFKPVAWHGWSDDTTSDTSDMAQRKLDTIYTRQECWHDKTQLTRLTRHGLHGEQQLTGLTVSTAKQSTGYIYIYIYICMIHIMYIYI